MGFLDLEFKQPRSGSSATPSCQGHRPQGAKKKWYLRNRDQRSLKSLIKVYTIKLIG